LRQARDLLLDLSDARVELRRVVRDDHGLTGRLRGLALRRDVHPVVERLPADRVAGDGGDRVARDAAATPGQTGRDHKKGAKRQNRTPDLHRGVMVARVSRGGVKNGLRVGWGRACATAYAASRVIASS